MSAFARLAIIYVMKHHLRPAACPLKATLWDAFLGRARSSNDNVSAEEPPRAQDDVPNRHRSAPAHDRKK